MSDEIKLSAEARENTGKGASRRLRKENKVPAIVYGGKKEPQMISLVYKDMIKAMENESFYTQVLVLEVDGKKEKTVLRDLQRHPSRGEPTHADFQRIDAKQKLHTVVPIHFLNEESSIGVKQQGGEIQRNAAEVEVISLPKDIPNVIEVDLADVELDQVIHLSDLDLPKGVEILVLTHGEEYDQPVVVIRTPKGQETEAELAEDEATAEVESANDAEDAKAAE